MNKHFQDFVLSSTGATAITSQQVIQTLWSGYGEIVRLGLAGGPPSCGADGGGLGLGWRRGDILRVAVL